MNSKIIISLLFLCSPCMKGICQQRIVGTTSTLTVVINKFRNSKGNAGIALYQREDGFPKSAQKAVSIIYTSITNNKSVASFENLPGGEYAISICHDENNNKKLDTNFLGIPKEGIGASNNAKGRMGPPKYRDAKFNFGGKPQTIAINITYLL